MASPKCKACLKAVYRMDPQINMDGIIFHKGCAKCADCNCQITLSNFVKSESGDNETLLLCKTHYIQRFKEGGHYVGEEKFHSKSSRVHHHHSSHNIKITRTNSRTENTHADSTHSMTRRSGSSSRRPSEEAEAAQSAANEAIMAISDPIIT